MIRSTHDELVERLARRESDFAAQCAYTLELRRALHQAEDTIAHWTRELAVPGTGRHRRG